MTKPVNNLAASIVNDPSFVELKTEVYEQVKGDHATAVSIFHFLQECANEATENKFYEGNPTSPKKEKVKEEAPDYDPDLDTSLTPAEIAARK